MAWLRLQGARAPEEVQVAVLMHRPSCSTFAGFGMRMAARVLKQVLGWAETWRADVFILNTASVAAGSYDQALKKQLLQSVQTR